MRKLVVVVPVVLTLTLAAVPYSASAYTSGHRGFHPTVSTTLRVIARYPDGLTSPPGEQVLTADGRDVVMLLEDDATSGGCLHDQLAEVDLATGKLRLGLPVTCYAWLFRSGTGQMYMTRPYHHGTELVQVNSVTQLVRSYVVGFDPLGFRSVAPVSGTDFEWCALVGRIALFDLATGKVLRTLRLPDYASGRPDGLALAEPGGPLYVTFSDPHRCRYFCAVLAEVDPATGSVLVRRRVDHGTAWPVATKGGVFVGLYNGGTGVGTNVYSATGLRPLSGGGFGGTVGLFLTATGNTVWWSAAPPGASHIFCGWITHQGSLGYLALQFKKWGFVWGNPVGIQSGTGDLLLAGTAATAKIGVYGLFAISTPRQCKEHM